MTTQDLIEYYGSKIKAAAALGVSLTTINNWEKKGIPHIKQLAIQTITKGKLKAETSHART
jgi:DNA-binding transcriptional regulator YdaS (Cro superfamily)